MADSSSRAVKHQRERLARARVVAGIVLGVGISLALLFPREPLLAMLRTQKPADAVNIDFLRAALRSDDNPELRLLLVAQELRAGNFPAAQRALAPLVGHAPAAYAGWVRWLHYRARVAATYAAPAGSAARLRGEAALRAMIPRLVTEVPSPMLPGLARDALALDDAADAVPIYLRLARLYPARSAAFHARAAATALSLGRYQESARLYFAAQAAAKDPSARREYLLAAAHALQSGNRPKQALAAAKTHLGTLGNDPEVLRFMVNLALAANVPRDAAFFSRRLLGIQHG
ncbi:MAG: hypothetical protein KGJ12_06390 [Gammaproteobacteria bacterium]|nr:hypothetical protein [Gammaproteobacteria bacterium]